MGQKTRGRRISSGRRAATTASMRRASACATASASIAVPRRAIPCPAAATRFGKLTNTGRPAATRTSKWARSFSSLFMTTRSGRSCVRRAQSAVLVPPTPRQAGHHGGRLGAEAGDADQAVAGAEVAQQLGDARHQADDPPRRRGQRQRPAEVVGDRAPHGGALHPDRGAASAAGRGREAIWPGRGLAGHREQPGDRGGREGAGEEQGDDDHRQRRSAPAVMWALALPGRATPRRALGHQQPTRLVSTAATASQPLRRSHPSTPLYQRSPSAAQTAAALGRARTRARAGRPVEEARREVRGGAAWRPARTCRTARW